MFSSIIPPSLADFKREATRIALDGFPAGRTITSIAPLEEVDGYDGYSHGEFSKFKECFLMEADALAVTGVGWGRFQPFTDDIKDGFEIVLRFMPCEGRRPE